MFKNRAFVVKIVNDADIADAQDALPPVSAPEYMSIARETVSEVGGYAIVIVGGYMIADTLRQIAVHTAKTYIK